MLRSVQGMKCITKNVYLRMALCDGLRPLSIILAG